MNSDELRSSFLNFFAGHDHRIVPSSSLVPADDPSLLFTNAGMVQFKNVFLGQQQLDFKRATSSQRCVRVGGKHNDLENVGYTERHHTFFEMLGNFSFGDYFKREAIAYAWDYVTGELKLPEKNLWVTVFAEDHESEELWLNKIGVSPQRFARMQAADNFWSMGPVGPCGPCSEIYYDHNNNLPGHPPGSGDEGDRFVEIWNLVFMQYSRDKKGRMTDLPKPSVDTGMGLERIAAVMQGVSSNYDTDLFKPLLAAVAELTQHDDVRLPSIRVIADHIRSCCALLADGVMPANEGRGYVVRRIIRRAARHGHHLNVHEPFFYRLVKTFSQQMGKVYPALLSSGDLIEAVLQQEEDQFQQALQDGLKVLEKALSTMSGRQVPAELVFKLYDTYGFPVDLTADIGRERGLLIDMQGFDALMEEQRARARRNQRFIAAAKQLVEVDGSSDFVGYEKQKHYAQVRHLFIAGEPGAVMSSGQSGIVVLDETPFYAEAGGQVGDTGVLVTAAMRFRVDDTQKQGEVVKHLGVVEDGELREGDQVEARVDTVRRQHIACNHSATHLLHAALKSVLGLHVQQKGSLVEADRLRFDFSHPQPLSAEQKQAVENLVNQKIRENNPTEVAIMSKHQALEAGAVALFGEKYADQVRVLSMGDFSKELCGGTHVKRGGDIGFFKLTAESGVAAGVRRLEAITGEAAAAYLSAREATIEQLCQLLKTDATGLLARTEQLLNRCKKLEKSMHQHGAVNTRQLQQQLDSQVVQLGELKVLAAQVEGFNRSALRQLIDPCKARLGDQAVVVLASPTEEGKVQIVAGVGRSCTELIKANELVNALAQKLGGGGGGRADMAEAGGQRLEALPAALAGVKEWVQAQLHKSGSLQRPPAKE